MSSCYFDCFSGAAGDMILGAMLDAGLPMKYLLSELKKLKVGDYRIVKAHGHMPIKGTNIRIEVKKELGHGEYSWIDKTIEKSSLSPAVKELSRAIFGMIARAEAKVHGVSLDKVHFHEVGATDSIVDIVGAAIGFEYFGFDSVSASPLPMSRGKVKCAHGFLPLPAPATAEILKGIPTEPAIVKGELVTPTGAAILKTACEFFGESPIQKIERVGYGYGDKVFEEMPNALRMIVGEGFPMIVIQANIDDMNPQIFDYVIESLFSIGAADVDMAPVQMKKNRPAVRISALVPWGLKDDAIDIFLRETTTFGVKYWPVDRKVLCRKMVEKKVRRGKLRFKLGLDDDGRVIKAVPEYDDVKALAAKTGKPMIDLYLEAQSDARRFFSIGR